MRIYISTPVNARNEKTFAEKYAAASKRVEEIKEFLKANGEDAEFVSFVDVAPLGECTESQAMGRCVQAVMESDMLIMDNRSGICYAKSKGCYSEFLIACIYKKEVIYLSEYKNEH